MTSLERLLDRKIRALKEELDEMGVEYGWADEGYGNDRYTLAYILEGLCRE